MRTNYFLLAGALLFFLSVQPAAAGFGITPPYVKNASLTRNSVYEQTIILSRSDPVDDLNVQVSVDLPGANDWLSVDKGRSFVMHKDEQTLPMTVKVTVPGNAKFGNYKGNLRVVISPLTGPTPGTVGVALGAQIDVDLNIIDKKIYDFKVRGVHVSPLETGHQTWLFFFPGKIRFSMQIENTGNISYSPTRVAMDIKSADGTIVETTENLSGLEKVDPFQIKTVIAELPTRLPAGSYQAAFRIYNQDTVAHRGELDLSVLPYGAIPGYAGFGLLGLTRNEQLLAAGLGVGTLALIMVLIWGMYKLWRRALGMHEA